MHWRQLAVNHASGHSRAWKVPLFSVCTEPVAYFNQQNMTELKLFQVWMQALRRPWSFCVWVFGTPDPSCEIPCYRLRQTMWKRGYVKRERPRDETERREKPSPASLLAEPSSYLLAGSVPVTIHQQDEQKNCLAELSPNCRIMSR